MSTGNGGWAKDRLHTSSGQPLRAEMMPTGPIPGVNGSASLHGEENEVGIEQKYLHFGNAFDDDDFGGRSTAVLS